MSANPPKILVVDDEPQIRRLLKTSLMPQKFEIAEAGTAGVALKRIDAEEFDLIILDLGLPDRSGIEVIEEVRKTSSVPIIVLSVRSDEGAGIPLQSLEAIFNKFTRLAAEDRTRAGTGLGLPICRGFITAMGGTIAASNRQDRSGAIFTIRLAKAEPVSESVSRVEAYVG